MDRGAEHRSRSVLPPHEFLALPVDVPYEQYMAAVRDPSIPRVKVDDELIRMMGPTLAWVRTINPAIRGALAGYGLNLYGPTAFDTEAAGKLERIVEGWISIFMEAPETVRFPLSREAALDGPLEDVPRETVVESLQRLSTLASRVATDTSTWMLHLGI